MFMLTCDPVDPKFELFVPCYRILLPLIDVGPLSVRSLGNLWSNKSTGSLVFRHIPVSKEKKGKSPS